MHRGTYKTIINNVKKIKHRDLLGAAVTLNYSNRDMISTIKSLINYFPTISIKPVRSNFLNGISSKNIDSILNEYDNLAGFLLEKSLKGDLKYLSAILNGDDYFGKFLTRVFLNQKVYTRCDIGFGRSSLGNDGSIYTCPAAIGIDDLKIGNLNDGIDYIKVAQIYEAMTNRKQCDNCEARFVCGGECLVNAYYQSKSFMANDPIMCKLKKHLFKIAVIFVSQIRLSNLNLHNVIHRACEEKNNRFKADKDLSEVLDKVGDKYTFTELKRIKDEDYDLFEKLKK
jgi:uncharacterized protein